MKKLAFILSIDFIYAGIILFLVFHPTKQSTKQAGGTLHGYVYAEWSSNKKTEQVFLPGVLITVKDASGNTADITKSGSDGSYATKQLKFGDYKIYLSKIGFPGSSHEAFVGLGSNEPDSLKLNVNNENYRPGDVRLRDGSADY
ncbi:MAG TPA: carboxypeptidase-like regulatory domain-containing protein [Mucilaginibacter sp.]|jgi:hypothetical protein